MAADATNQDRLRHGSSNVAATATAAVAAATTLVTLGLAGVTTLAVPHAAIAADDEPPAPHTPAPAPESNNNGSTRPILPPPAPAPEGGVAVPAATGDPSTAPVPDPQVAGVTPADPTKGDNKTAQDPKDVKKPKPGTPDGRGAFGGNSAEKVLGPIGKGLFISGGASLSSRSYNVAGTDQARQAYDQQYNYLGFGTGRVGPFQQNMDLTIQGKFLNVFNVNARLTNNRQGNYYNQSFGFNYDRKGTSLDIGDVAATLPGNQFVTFSRTLRGLQFGRDFGGGTSFKGLASLTNSVTRRGTFRGNGTSGPYPMNAASIIPGTVTVRLNGQTLVEGQDYTVEPQLGTLRFTQGRIINEADTVEYTYESANYNSTPGLMTGMRFDQALSNGSAIGFTLLRQTPTNRNSGSDKYIERFPVSSNISDAYYLVAEIQANSPVVVTYVPASGITQTLQENVDYTLNRPLHYIRLLRALPPDVSGIYSLQVQYLPVKQAGVGAEKTVIGLDGQTRLGNGATLSMQFGRSQGASDTGSGGNALALTATFKGSDKLSGDIGWTDIGQGFSTIDSTAGAFLQIQKGLRGSLNYSPSQFVTFRSTMNQSRIATEQAVAATETAAAGTQLVWSNNTTWTSGVTLSMPNLPRIDLSHNQTAQTSQLSGSSRSTFTSDQLNLAWQKGIFGLNSAFGRTVSHGSSVFSSTGYASGLTGSSAIDPATGLAYTTSTSDTASNTARFDMSLTPAWWLAIRGALGFSRSTSGGTYGSATNARDTSLGLSLPIIPERLQFGINWADSTNGRSTTSAGNQVDENGNPIPGSQLTTTDGQRTRTTSFTAHYTPIDVLDFTLELSRSLSLIPGYDNTDTNSRSITTSYTPFPRLSLTGSFMDQKLRYLGSQTGNSNNRSYMMSAQAGPFFGKMTFTASYQKMDTGSALNYGSNGSGLSIPGISNGTTGTTGDTSLYNYAQQQKMNIFSLRADYPIGGNRSLFFQWQNLDARSPDGTSSAATSSSYYASSNYRRGVGTLGLEIRLNELMSFTLESNLINMHDNSDSKYSYKARSLNMDLSARF